LFYFIDHDLQLVNLFEFCLLVSVNITKKKENTQAALQYKESCLLGLEGKVLSSLFV